VKIKSLKYTVSVEISENWISDGFTLTEENLRDAILRQLLTFAREDEVKVKILTQPGEETIAAVQGDNKFLLSNGQQFRKVRKPIQATATAWR
jgi:hypothetical protein